MYIVRKPQDTKKDPENKEKSAWDTANGNQEMTTLYAIQDKERMYNETDKERTEGDRTLRLDPSGKYQIHFSRVTLVTTTNRKEMGASVLCCKKSDRERKMRIRTLNRSSAERSQSYASWMKKKEGSEKGK